MVVKVLIENLCPFETTTVPEKFFQKADDELFENSDSRVSSLKYLRELISAENDFSCQISEEFLLQFLRARKFDVPKAFGLLKKFKHFKDKNKVLFTDMNYDIILKLIKTKTIRFLPYRCPEGCAIIAVHLDNWNPSEVSVEELSKCLALFLYHSITDPITQISGYKVLLDVKSHPWKHLRFCTPHNIYLLYNGTQECFPGRFKGIHVINMSLTFKAAWTLIQPFLSDKLKKRIVFHQNNNSLQDHFPKCMLPVDFGGDLEKIDNTPWLKQAFQENHLKNLAD